MLSSRFRLARTPLLSKYSPLSVFQAAAPPIRVMACKADLYSLIITKQLYTCEYTAIDCTIMMLIGAGFETSALDFTCTPLFQNSGENTVCVTWIDCTFEA